MQLCVGSSQLACTGRVLGVVCWGRIWSLSSLPCRLRSVALDVDGIVRAVRSNVPRHGLAGGKPVPLGQMLDILADVWEIEGLGKL